MPSTAATKTNPSSKSKARGGGNPPLGAAGGTNQLLAALRAFRRGDFAVRLPKGLTGVEGEIAEAFNDVVEMNDRMTREFERLGEIVGRQGKITTGPDCRRRRAPGRPASMRSTP